MHPKPYSKINCHDNFFGNHKTHLPILTQIGQYGIIMSIGMIPARMGVQ